jgi:hypothetical protein
VLPVFNLVVQLFPLVFTQVVGFGSVVLKDRLQDGCEQEYYAIWPSFVVKLAEDGGMTVAI